MASNVSGTPTGAPTYREPHANDWTIFAACLMILGGVMAILEGVAAIVNHHRYLVTWDYVYRFNISGWGWLHLALGIVIVLAGVSQFTHAPWARVLGVTVVGASMIAHFLWLPYFPFWAFILIGIDIFIIWALTGGTHREHGHEAAG